MALWEVAAFLGRNRPAEDLRDPWPDDAPPLKTMRRLRALRRGERPPSADAPIGEDEYVELLDLAEGSRRRDREEVTT